VVPSVEATDRLFFLFDPLPNAALPFEEGIKRSLARKLFASSILAIFRVAGSCPLYYQYPFIVRRLTRLVAKSSSSRYVFDLFNLEKGALGTFIKEQILAFDTI